MKKRDYEAILNLPMQENDAEAETIRDYLCHLLLTVWEEQESFSGKRPFGNSGWDYDLMETLVRHAVINGVIHEEGWLDDFDKDEGHVVINNCILEMCRKR